MSIHHSRTEEHYCASPACAGQALHKRTEHCPDVDEKTIGEILRAMAEEVRTSNELRGCRHQQA